MSHRRSSLRISSEHQNHRRSTFDVPHSSRQATSIPSTAPATTFVDLGPSTFYMIGSPSVGSSDCQCQSLGSRWSILEDGQSHMQMSYIPMPYGAPMMSPFGMSLMSYFFSFIYDVILNVL